uniref:Uncharacterized protein n=1 Tax=Geospiza parvula TaxID=87175 RepID=A0A8U8BNQ0_GEOPR
LCSAAAPQPRGAMEELPGEASCPICREYFREPVSIHCGHHFCRACIERCWEWPTAGFACPRCRDTAPQRSLRPSRELERISHEITPFLSGLEIFLQTPTPNPLPTPAADVTLDPSTAHPRLSLSLDRRSVRLSERRAEPADGARQPRPDGGTGSGDLCVLGSPGFTGGRHYWEVEVGGRRGWAVGAARASARGRPQSAQSGPAAPPKREIWALGTSGKKYQALTATEQTALVPAEQPRRFGVYLDYDRGQLCFYNAESMSHIHTFHICSIFGLKSSRIQSAPLEPFLG